MKKEVKKFIKEQYEAMYPNEEQKMEEEFNVLKKELGLKPAPEREYILKNARNKKIFTILTACYTVILAAVIIVSCTQRNLVKKDNSLYKRSITFAEEYFANNNIEKKNHTEFSIELTDCIVNLYCLSDIYFQIYFGDKVRRDYDLSISVDSTLETNIYTNTIENIQENFVEKLDYTVSKNDVINIELYKNNILVIASSYQII